MSNRKDIISRLYRTFYNSVDWKFNELKKFALLKAKEKYVKMSEKTVGLNRFEEEDDESLFYYVKSQE